MSGITPRGQAKLGRLAEVQRAAQTIHGLTEQFATAKSGDDQIARQIKRRYRQYKLQLTAAGFDHLSQLAAAMEIAAGRTNSWRTKVRILRDGIASIRIQLEVEEKEIVRSETVERENTAE